MREKEHRSITINMLLNMIKGTMGVVFPLITFPYVSRVLGVDALGQYNFASSIVSYFIMIAELGISTYAIRSGAGYRDNRNKLNTFVSETFTINALTTCASYILLFIFLRYAGNIEGKTLVLVLALQILFKTISVEWIYSIFEDYLFITVRSIIFQFVSLILMFILVRSQEDVIWYAAITVISSAGAGLLGLFHAYKYCTIHLTAHPNIKTHMKPIMVFFATSLAVLIYVNSDMTLLGLISGSYSVGIYSVSAKVYTLLKNILASAIVVSIPRMSTLWEKHEIEEFQHLGSDIYDIFLTLVIPVIVGIILLNKEIVILIAGAEFLQARDSLTILSIALFFCLGAGFWSQGVLIPQNEEKTVFKITMLSAVINIVLNCVLIPLFQERAAAITTVVAEATVFLYCRHKGRKSQNFKSKWNILCKIIIGCIPMLLINLVIKQFIAAEWLVAILTMVFCVPSYFWIEYKLANKTVVKYWEKARHKKR